MMLQIHEFFQNKMNFANELGKFALQRYRVYIYICIHILTFALKQTFGALGYDLNEIE